MWKAGPSEFSQLQQFCTSQKQEVEADIVAMRYVSFLRSLSGYYRKLVAHASYRLLAYVGFDPREAVRFWESRSRGVQTAERSPARAEAVAVYEASIMAMVGRIRSRSSGQRAPTDTLSHLYTARVGP